MISSNDLIIYLAILSFGVIKYCSIMGTAYYVFWIVKPSWLNHFKKIQVQERAKPQVQLEMKYSAYTLFLQSLCFFLIYKMNEQGLVHIVSEQSLWKDLFALLIYVLIYDPFFYFLHKIMHQNNWLYRHVHVVHHRSLNPTPWATYSFHPIEAVANMLYFFPFLFLTSVSWPMFIVILVFTDMANLAGHLGYEVFSEKIQDSWWGRWITTPTHHNIHHQVSKSNFGLYFNGWDLWFKTLNAKDKRKN
jgi:sterol desaturase/sphingolipid hydroxylase (fatty acid hydroxylase superfamily)